MNGCYICAGEAVSRCYTCGQLICAKHGGENCERCNTGVVAGDPRPQHIRAEVVSRLTDTRHAWWRPQAAEDFEPPGCYACSALSRAICQNCLSYYCREHAGPGPLCQVCGRSARLGLIVFFVAVGLLAGLIFLGSFWRMD
jgi:hypothetical protein